MSLPQSERSDFMTYKDLLKLSEGTHVVTVNTERCMVIRMRDGYTLTRFLPDRTMLIQLYSEKGHLLREDRLDNFFAATEETTQDEQEENHEDSDC